MVFYTYKDIWRHIMKKDRNINLDIIRCVAVLTVICVHFFLHNGYYNIPVLGKKMYIATIMRTAFMVCVPLFLLLTGYLMNKKTLSKKYDGMARGCRCILSCFSPTLWNSWNVTCQTPLSMGFSRQVYWSR